MARVFWYESVQYKHPYTMGPEAQQESRSKNQAGESKRKEKKCRNGTQNRASPGFVNAHDAGLRCPFGQWCRTHPPLSTNLSMACPPTQNHAPQQQEEEQEPKLLLPPTKAMIQLVLFLYFLTHIIGQHNMVRLFLAESRVFGTCETTAKASIFKLIINCLELPNISFLSLSKPFDLRPNNA